MAHDCTITAALLQRQRTMFRVASEQGFSQKVICADTGLSLSIIGQYARGETAMSGPSILKVRRSVGPALVSMLFDDGDHLVTGGGELDYDTFAGGCLAYAAAHAHARSPASPGGVAIVSCEETTLNSKAVGLRVVGK